MPPAKEHIQHFHRLRMAAAMVAQLIVGIVIAYMTPFLDKEPYHTSILSGHAWVQELVNGHPNRIKNELGMRKNVFRALVQELEACGLRDSKYILLDEQVAIFLYTCVTGLSSRHVAERFQHSHTTIQKYVCSARYLLWPHTCHKIFQESPACIVFSPILQQIHISSAGGRTYTKGNIGESQTLPILFGCAWSHGWYPHCMLSIYRRTSTVTESQRWHQPKLPCLLFL
jgi:hypothetical protein